jgi:hypothetical protein
MVDASTNQRMGDLSTAPQHERRKSQTPAVQRGAIWGKRATAHG